MSPNGLKWSRSPHGERPSRLPAAHRVEAIRTAGALSQQAGMWTNGAAVRLRSGACTLPVAIVGVACVVVVRQPGGDRLMAVAAGGDRMAVMSAERERSDTSGQKARVKPPLDPAKREFTTLLKIEPNE